MNVEPGSMVSLLPGEDIRFFEGDPSGQGYADFVRQQLLGVAAGLGIPYEFLTGDMSKVNDRVMRVLLNEYHRLIEQTQWLLIIPQICTPVWEAFIDTAVLAGVLNAPGYGDRRSEYLAVEWRTDRWPYMNPLQDAQAAELLVRAGLDSRSGQIADRGGNAEDVDRQNAEDKNRAESMGLKYSSDPANDKGSMPADAGDRRREEEEAA
jgi:lambda family phage portal protein